MSNYKNFRKNLKNPDQFQRTVYQGASWMARFRRELAIAGCVMVLAVVGILGWQYYQNMQLKRRHKDFSKVESILQKENERIGEERKKISTEIADLEKKQTEEKDKVKKDALKTKIETLQKQRDAIEPDYKGALTDLRGYYEKYKKTPEGWMAGTRVAAILMKQKDFEGAKAIFSEIAKVGRDNKFYATMTQMNLANISEELKDYDAALGHVEELAKISSKELQPKILLMKSRIQMEKNQKDDAKATLDKIISEHASAPEAKKAKNLKALMVN